MGEKKGSGMVGNGDYMLAALKRYFGFDSFRPGQEEAVGAVISGRDVMAVMPTGGGKSVCYQLPAARPGTFTLVVTPLRALMRDQVRHLRSRGIPAALIDSGLDEKERAEVYGRALSGELRILYVAPERLHAPDFADFSHRIRISLLAVDEAHCVLHWGSDFRPSYMRIGEFIDSLSPRPVTMALTATASRTQAGEIRELLHLADPVTVTTDADRPNLRLTVVRARPGERLEAMIAWAKRHKGSGIIYKENRKGCERLAETLRSEGIDAMAFHAEMRDADKKRVQDGFLAGHPRVICATSAFGMGVDKPDVRWVLNDGPCKSLEAYWQEAGRAGRDGKPADAVLYWSPGDWRWLRHAAWEAKSRAEESGDPSRIRAAQLMDSRLDAMSAYCETRRCLRRTILAMFDPPGTRRDDCSNCSNCQADGREIVKKPASNPYRRRRTAPETGEGQGEPMGRESIRIACRYIANIQRELGHGVRLRHLPRRRQMSGSGRTIPIGAAELRAIRERESVLEQTLARLTGVDTATVERIENGETPLSTLEPDQIRQWAKTLGVNPARLTGETPQEGEGATTVIRRMRTERGWSCPQLAAHANVPYRSLRQYDSGERDTANMAAGILARVAIALDTSMEKLAGRPEPDHATDNPPAGWDGTRLAWHRTRQGLSQAELAIRAGQTTQTIGGIETRRWATGSKRSRIILDLAAGLGIQALDLMDQTPEGKPRMNDPKPAKTEHSATADDLVYRNHVNAAIDQLRLALRTADTGERIRLLTGALANTGNAIGQLAQFDSDGRARPPRK